MKAEPQLLSRMYHAIMLGFVRDGRAPHYTNLAQQLGLGVEDARRTLHELIEMGLPTWLASNTDYIASFAPFSSIPTQYLVTVDGQQRWYAQCGFESLAITWMFPGQAVRIEAPCLDCGDPMALEMLDGRLHRIEPLEMVGHLNEPYTMSKARLPFV